MALCAMRYVTSFNDTLMNMSFHNFAKVFKVQFDFNKLKRIKTNKNNPCSLLFLKICELRYRMVYIYYHCQSIEEYAKR